MTLNIQLLIRHRKWEAHNVKCKNKNKSGKACVYSETIAYRNYFITTQTEIILAASEKHPVKEVQGDRKFLTKRGWRKEKLERCALQSRN